MEQELKRVMMEAAQSAGAVMKKYFQQKFEINSKDSINNLVTEVDNHCEKVIIEIIQLNFPDHKILSEEVGEVHGPGDYLWIIDPIDGTVNFAHGIPLCCVSIGLMQDKSLIMGTVYNPLMNELFFAEKGKGAYLNEQKISVSSKADFNTSCLVTGFPYNWPDTKEHPVKVFERLILQGLPIRRLGSAAIDLCWVACGRFEGFWEYNLSAWDVAAGYLIVTEAGGRVSNFDGDVCTVFDKETLATNSLIHEEMLRQISKTAV